MQNLNILFSAIPLIIGIGLSGAAVGASALGRQPQRVRIRVKKR